ncbi:PAS domain-containing protein [Sphingobium sp. H33]|uniref:PAS domain-containing protein n=2 Tax=Sphingobium nicotianae TaxID=2782607 RepID=A0A9X1DAQ2_9SPHN|nr:PAS domain-containing protein [Sphingobium nicotianae]
MINGSEIAAVLTNPRAQDNPIIFCNSAFEKLTGYPADEILGRNCRFLAGPNTDRSAVAQLREAISRGRPVMVELLNYRRDGTAFRNAVTIAPLFDDQGDLEYFLGTQVDLGSLGSSPSRAENARRKLAILSPRQRQVLAELAAGKTTKQVAFDFGLAEPTVKTHRSALLHRLEVRTVVEAIRLAIEAGY